MFKNYNAFCACKILKLEGNSVLSTKAAFKNDFNKKQFGILKEVKTKIQSDQIYLSLTPNIQLKCPNTPKKSIVMKHVNKITEFLQINNVHVTFLNCRSSAWFPCLQNKAHRLKSISLSILEHLLMPDLDDE